MRAIGLFALGLLATGLTTATTAGAAKQLYQGSWVVESFGNDLTTGTGASAQFSVFGIPQGLQCNPVNPRCPIASTPVNTTGYPNPRGPYCTPYTVFGTARPAKGMTPLTPLGRHGVPVYRNPAFFTAGGMPRTTSCTGTTALVQKGMPLAGTGVVTATTLGVGADITLAPAAENPLGPGMRRTTLGSFNNSYPYLYTYTYATLRNDAGAFGKSKGPGSFSVPYKRGGVTVAKAVVKQGPNRFGGVMRLLGQITTKACYVRNGRCWRDRTTLNWHYEAIGASAYTSAGVVIGGYIATDFETYYHPYLKQTFAFLVLGSRFPWTTGSVTVTATGRGPHKTFLRRHGYDNRTPSGKGKIQMVSPTLTRWLQPCCQFDTGGIAVLNFEFTPEPGKWTLLVAGLSLVGVLYRARRR